MKRLVLTDSLIREALAPDQHTTAPAGLLARIAEDVTSTPQPPSMGLPALARSRRLAWIAIGTAALLALLGTLLFAGGGPNPLKAILPPGPTPSALVAQTGPSPTPAPTATPQITRLRPDLAGATRLLGLDAGHAWAVLAADSGATELWYRSSDGSWGGPHSVDGAGIVRDLQLLPDGRLAFATGNGIWVGDATTWGHVWAQPATAIAVDGHGTVWAAGLTEQGTTTLRSLRTTAGEWAQDWSGCQAGGSAVAIAADGAVWTAGIDYSGTAGIARVKDGRCEEVFPLGDGVRHDVPSIAASPTGAVVALVMDTTGDQWSSGHLVEWRDGRWTELGSGPELARTIQDAVAYTPDGTLWTSYNGSLLRWSGRSAAPVASAWVQSPISAAADGAVWYIGTDGVIDRVDPATFSAGAQQAAASPAGSGVPAAP